MVLSFPGFLMHLIHCCLLYHHHPTTPAYAGLPPDTGPMLEQMYAMEAGVAELGSRVAALEGVAILGAAPSLPSHPRLEQREEAQQELSQHARCARHEPAPQQQQQQQHHHHQEYVHGGVFSRRRSV